MLVHHMMHLVHHMVHVVHHMMMMMIVVVHRLHLRRRSRAPAAGRGGVDRGGRWANTATGDRTRAAVKPIAASFLIMLNLRCESK